MKIKKLYIQYFPNNFLFSKENRLAYATPEEDKERRAAMEEYKNAKADLDNQLDTNAINPQLYDTRLQELKDEYGIREEDEAKEEAQNTARRENRENSDSIDNLIGSNRSKINKVTNPEVGFSEMDKMKNFTDQLKVKNQQINELEKKFMAFLDESRLSPPRGFLNRSELYSQDFDKDIEFLRDNYAKVDGKSEKELNDELNKLKESFGWKSYFTKKTSDKIQDRQRRIEIENILLPQIETKKNEINSYILLKEEGSELDKQLNEHLESLTKIDLEMQELQSKERTIEIATRMTGISISEGTKLRFTDTRTKENGEKENVEREFSIDKVEFKSTDKVKNALTITISEVNGSKDDCDGGVYAGEYSIANFKKRFADKEDVVEIFDNIEDLNKKLGWDVNIRPGIELEYNEYKRDDEGKLLKIPKTVKVENIEDNKIILDKEVDINIDPSIEGGKRNYGKEMDFGQFAKWYRNRESSEKIENMENLREKLKKLNNFYNTEFERKPEDYPPIEVSEGEALKVPGDTSPGAIKYFIQGITPQGNIKIEGDGEMTPTQFFRWVKDSGVEKYDPIIESRKKLILYNEDDLAEEEKQELIKKAEEEEKKSLEEALEKVRQDGVAPPEAGEPPTPIYGWNADAIWNKTSLWHNMRLLSLYDVKEMGKTIYEFVVRRYQRGSKARYGSIGEKLPGRLGTEFAKVKQAAENDEVAQYKSAMDAWGVTDIKDTLYDTNNTDEAKACFQVLTSKGELRWDDPKMWRTLEKLTHMDYGSIKTGTDCQGPIDSLWGTGQWHEWFGTNISTYNNQKNNFEWKGKMLENDPAGISKEMTRLLTNFKKGEYVNPMEYEELIDFAILWGKGGVEDKIFFLIAGVITDSPKGYGPLLSMDRLAEIDSKHCNRFPFLDFIASGRFYCPTDIEEKIASGEARNEDEAKKILQQRKFARKDFEWFKDHYFKDDYENNVPGIQTTKFIWEKMLTNHSTRVRLSKGLRNADQMDHDDAHMFLPPATGEEMENLLGSISGNKKYFTPQGYLNAFPGFSQYMLTLAKNSVNTTNEDERRESNLGIMEGIRAYIAFDTITANRYKKARSNDLQRLSDTNFEKRSVVDGVATKYHRNQMRNLIEDIAKNYAHLKAGKEENDVRSKKNLQDDLDMINYLFKVTIPQGVVDSRDKQRKLEEKIGLFIENKVKEWYDIDNGELMVKTICEHSQRPLRDPINNDYAANSLLGLGSNNPTPEDRIIKYQIPPDIEEKLTKSKQ
ncbi:MAG: hypothetical protein UR27_C0016G0002 [Candidatus Peregrinibacteria bacterium GW2011_GWA2_33_10]|nr:MAG: hypothetical protein UR27_C0016G0002 [Candidatus Peregrinibacteria bacterium GW2011_GWA2_33_10]KKP38492.1 MAG: hypothetical protein UR30_C0018G0019 [Candidatus Peregrinibacteria bacterium GW2011_GWC2_33_13]